MFTDFWIVVSHIQKAGAWCIGLFLWKTIRKQRPLFSRIATFMLYNYIHIRDEYTKIWILSLSTIERHVLCNIKLKLFQEHSFHKKWEEGIRFLYPALENKQMYSTDSLFVYRLKKKKRSGFLTFESQTFIFKLSIPKYLFFVSFISAIIQPYRIQQLVRLIAVWAKFTRA